jgi:hypothetical protein
VLAFGTTSKPEKVQAFLLKSMLGAGRMQSFMNFFLH